jgi:hypothetical protein
MPSWLLLVFLFATWFVWVIACAAEKAVDGARRGLPEGQRGGVSILPGIPVFPLVFWGIALLIDLVVEPWGTWGIGLAHGVFLVLLMVSIMRNWFRLRSFDKDAKV